MSYFKETGIIDTIKGSQAFVDDFHSLQVNESVKLIGKAFNGTTKDTNFWTESVTGTGSVTQTGGFATLATGATANSTVQYQSNRKAAFVPAQSNVFRTVMKLGDTGTANNIRNWGQFDANDGVFFQLNGTTLNIVTRAATSDTAVAKASWNGPAAAAFTLDTNIHSYEIRWSFVKYSFYIDEQLVHTKSVLGSSALGSQNIEVPVTFQNNNAGGSTSNINMALALGMVFRLGNLETNPTYAHISTATTTICKYGAGFLHNIIVNNPTNNNVTICDNISAVAPIIAIINPGASSVPVTLQYDCPFSTGLTIVTAGTPDLTIVYE